MKLHHLSPAEKGTGILTLRAPFTVTSSLLCLCLWTGGSFASTLDFAPMATTEILLAQRAIADSNVASAPVEPPAASASSGSLPSRFEVHKSSGRAFLYNVILPGAGHLYAGNKRGWAHLGLEGVAWASYFYYHERGTSKEDEYIAHADEHWNLALWQANYTGPDKAGADSLIQYFKAHNKQHYYEDIVKLNTYSEGWDDQANRNSNRGMRNASNNYLKDARYAVVGGFVNRVVSAFDVLRMMKGRSERLLGNNTRLRFNVRTKPFSDHTAVGFEIRKKL